MKWNQICVNNRRDGIRHDDPPAHEPSETPPGFGVRWLAGNGADTALDWLRVREPKRCVPSPLTHRTPRRWRAAPIPLRMMATTRGQKTVVASHESRPQSGAQTAAVQTLRAGRAAPDARGAFGLRAIHLRLSPVIGSVLFCLRVPLRAFRRKPERPSTGANTEKTKLAQKPRLEENLPRLRLESERLEINPVTAPCPLL